MADSDVLGILSLLLAAGGATYLIRARSGRNESALPAGAEGALRASGRASAAPVGVGGSDALSKAPPSPKEASRTPLKVSVTRPKRGRSGENGRVATAASQADTLPAPPESIPPKAPTAGDLESSASAASGAKPATTRSVSARSNSESPGSTKRGDTFDVPRLDFEEDEDVEPTRVKRGVERRAIQPPVEKSTFDDDASPRNGDASDNATFVVYAIAQSDPGKRRKQNEDSLLILENDGLFVVADGMGGHRGGQIASKLAVKTMSDAFDGKRFDGDPHSDLAPPASELARAIQMANAAILDEGTKRPELQGMGTTLCSVRFTADRRTMYLGHVGDSRCYRLRAGVMRQMTRDHTMADYGVTGPEGAHLSRALGVWPTVPIDIVTAKPRMGDLYLLCSDGLTKMLPDETIRTQLLHEEDPKTALERLVFFANAHGGKDNITIILMRMVEPGWKPLSQR